MVKHSVSFVRRFLQSVVIGGPQLAAAALLLFYLAQCLWLIKIQSSSQGVPNSDHALRVFLGVQQWKGGAVAGTPQSLNSEAITGLPSTGRSGHLRTREGFDQDRSPLYYLISGAPFALRPTIWAGDFFWWQVWAASPYLFFGVMLGASLWYVTRRLFGDAGGYIALALFCFSPAMIISVAGAQSLGEIGGVWGAFGAVWTAIAVAHTLYAPREVVLWNWRRILLLGLSLTLAIGNQFSLAILALVALLVMLWVAPVRKRAVLAIWGAACGMAVLLLAAAYFFHFTLFWESLRHARWLDLEWASLGSKISYIAIAEMTFRGSPALAFALPVASLAFVGWKRARYFGNTAPLIMALLLIAMMVLSPEFPGQGLGIAAIVFVYVFVAGVFADLLETKHGLLVLAGLSGLLIAAALWNLLQLARLAHG